MQRKIDLEYGQKYNDEGDWICTITGEVMDNFGNIIDEDDNNEIVEKADHRVNKM